MGHPLVGTVERMFVPGAARSTHLPRLEKRASSSFEFVALTAIAEGYAAGYGRLVVRSLPAAATTTAPLATASLTAFWSTLESPGPPSERFTTSAPLCTLHFMPS